MDPKIAQTILEECIKLFEFAEKRGGTPEVINLFKQLREMYNGLLSSKNDKIISYLRDNNALVRVAEGSLKKTWKKLNDSGERVGEANVLPATILDLKALKSPRKPAILFGGKKEAEYNKDETKKERELLGWMREASNLSDARKKSGVSGFSDRQKELLVKIKERQTENRAKQKNAA